MRTYKVSLYILVLMGKIISIITITSVEHKKSIAYLYEHSRSL